MDFNIEFGVDLPDAGRTTNPLPFPWDGMKAGIEGGQGSAVFTVPADFWTGERARKGNDGKYTPQWAKDRIRQAYKSWQARTAKAEPTKAAWIKGLVLVLGNGKEGSVMVGVKDLSPRGVAPKAKATGTTKPKGTTKKSA